MRLPLMLATLTLVLALAQAGSAKALAGCDAFLAKLRSEASELQIDFSHALVVSRARSDFNVFDITTKSDVDGVLTCRGDAFRRFEAHVAEPAPARALAGFERMQAVALHAALGWDAEKSRAMAHEMADDAKEYLAASKERGDVYVAGKTEEHAPGGISLGLIYTEADRAFVIVAGEQ